jgi:hypothetical protein
VNTSDFNEYAITDIRIYTSSIPDPDNLYFAEITEKASREEKSILLSLSSAGVIMDLDGNIPGTIFSDYSAVTVKTSPDRDDLFKYFAETNLLEQYDTIIKKVVVDTMTIEKTYLDKKWVEKSDDQKALEAANKITQIREARYNLLTGYHEVPFEASTIAYMDKQLVKMEQEFLSLFTGLSISKSISYTFTVVPDETQSSGSIPVCVFSERSGIKNINSAGGEKLNLKIESLGDFGTITSNANTRNGSGGEKGFFYRIPVMAKVSLEISNDLKVEEVFAVGQFGAVSYLPPNVTSVQFHRNTGAVKTILID